MTTAAEMVEFYTDAEIKVLKGQSIRFGERMLTMADLVEIRAGRAEWERKALNEGRKASGTSRVAYANFSGCG